MTTDLAQHIAALRVIDTHEHLATEQKWVSDGPHDVLTDLFRNYIPGDLRMAGASLEHVVALTNGPVSDVAARWQAVEPYWQAARHTGFAEAVRIQARDFYQLDEITVAGLERGQSRLLELRQPGMRLQILREQANLELVQTDHFSWVVEADAAGPEFFMHDIRWADFCRGQIDFAKLEKDTGVRVAGLTTLRQAMEELLRRFGHLAIALKAQHAYDRTLAWQERSDADAERALQIILGTPPVNVDPAAKLCLGDWCWARGCELAAQQQLPFKLHTGYLAGVGYMHLDPIWPGHLTRLLAKYPQTRFVLMHIGYPFGDDLIAIAKHFPNVWVDLCWAWSINPLASADFVRRFLSAVPANKLLGFGGDTGHPTTAYAYAVQMRRWLTRALSAAVKEEQFTEREAIDIATRVLRENQMACFDIAGRRAALRAAAAPPVRSAPLPV